jgi:DNA-binding FrmR family transcriptional regulator
VAVAKKGSYTYRSDEFRARLGRIEGQVRGISRMVEEGKYCVDILVQVAAVRAALDGVALGIMRDHIDGCVRDATGPDRAEVLDELSDVLERFVSLRR